MSIDLGNPQNRVEAILENMLGASNELQPPQTRVEELLMKILEQGGGGTEPVIKYKGVTTTPLTDGSTTNPVEIDGEEVTVETGDFVAHDGAEFIWNGTAWQELGDLELVAAIMTSIAPTYSESETYNTGDRVYYNDILYECLDNNVTGSFVPSKWSQISITQILAELENDIELIASDTQAVSAMISDTYKTTSTYDAGDLVIYNKKFYKCNTANTTGAWDASKWNETSVATQLNEIRSIISTLAEVVNGLIDDDSISADTTWSSSKIDSEIDDRTDVTKEVSGNPIEFSDGADAPLVKCVSAITGSQDLHGYDKPWVGGAGKNKLNPVLTNDYSAGGISITVQKDNAENIIGFNIPTATSIANNNITLARYICTTSGDYILSGCVLGGTISMSCRCLLWDETASDDVIVMITDENNSVSLISGHSYIVALIVQNTHTVGTSNLRPMLRLATETDQTFTPYSNICPITAYTEGKIEVRGKNLFDKDNANSITAYVTANSGLLEAGTTEHSIYLYLEQGTYTVQRIIPSSDTTTKRFRFRLFRNVPQIGEIGDVLYDGSTELTATVALPYSGYLLIFMFNGDSAWNARQEVFNSMQIEKGSSPTTYEPYTSTTHTTTFPSAIYRGSEDVVNGEVKSECKFMLFNGGSNESWAMSTGDNYHQFYVSDTSAISNRNMICNMFELINVSERSTKTGLVYNADNYFRVSLLDTMGITTVEQWKSFLAQNNLQIVADLATPTTSSVTPTNLPIKSLLGYNHIESSTGDLDIEYITEDFQPIVDLIEANASEPYSDDYTLDMEIEVGTWVDGSTLYRKTKEITGNKNAGYEGTIYTAESGEHIVKLDGCIYNDYYSGMAYPINMAYSTNNGTMAFSTFVTGSDAETVLFKNGWNSAISKIYLVVYYIKSSS